MKLTVAVEDAAFYVQNMRTRFPFQYGIASLTRLPHLFTRLRTRVNGVATTGLCAEHLPPKWFTKNPTTRFEEDLPDLIRVITHAAAQAQEIGREEMPYFAFWQALYAAQAKWAAEQELAPLLANLGVSVVERAVIDSICRHLDRPFGDLLRENAFAIDLGAVRPELANMQPADAVPRVPLSRVMARHTIGLGDPLVPEDVRDDERLRDGLPHTLRDCIETYGYRYFKIKLCGDLDRDGERLARLSALFEEMLGEDYHFTLDGNENYETMDQLITHWEAHQRHPAIKRLMTHLLFVEQPLHRDVALDNAVKAGLAHWHNHPPLIIDESDATPDDLSRALELGYAGTSHKNCKGIVKGLCNAGLLAQRRRQHPARRYILSGEDLANVGPLALPQDLCVMASLGIGHVERNGHHYFKGMAACPEDMQQAIVRDHGDLYAWREQGYASVILRDGALSTISVTRSRFGVRPLLDVGVFTPLEDWNPASLDDGC